jgi:hypothetical protein
MQRSSDIFQYSEANTHASNADADASNADADASNAVSHDHDAVSRDPDAVSHDPDAVSHDPSADDNSDDSSESSTDSDYNSYSCGYQDSPIICNDARHPFFLYVVSPWRSGNFCLEYGGKILVIARNQEECCEILEKAYGGNLRDIQSEVRYADGWRLANPNLSSGICSKILY